MNRRIVVTEFVTLDGVMEDPGGAEKEQTGFGGWAFAFDRGKAGDRFKLDELMEADAQLLGRVTYEGFAKAWPSIEDELGDDRRRVARDGIRAAHGDVGVDAHDR